MTNDSVAQIFVECAKKAGVPVTKAKNFAKVMDNHPVTEYFLRAVLQVEPILFGLESSDYAEVVKPILIRFALLPYFVFLDTERIISRQLLQLYSQNLVTRLIAISAQEQKKSGLLSAIVAKQDKWEKDFSLWLGMASQCLDKDFLLRDHSLVTTYIQSFINSFTHCASIFVDFFVLESSRYDRDMAVSLRDLLVLGMYNHSKSMADEFRTIIVRANIKALELFPEQIFTDMLAKIAEERFPLFGEFFSRKSNITKDFLKDCNRMTVPETMNSFFANAPVKPLENISHELLDINKDMERQLLRTEHISALVQLTDGMYPKD